MAGNQAFQILMTGVAVQLPNLPLSNQYIASMLASKVGNNAAGIAIGNSSAVTASTGFLLNPGLQIPVAVSNFNQLWAIGTAADVLSGIGS